MSDSEVEVLYTCLVCGKSYSKVQSLRAHFKAHKNSGFSRTSIWVEDRLWDEFKGVCKKHKTTTCHLLSTLIKATIKGEETGTIKIGSSNPVVVQVNEIFLGKPRSKFKVPLEVGVLGRIPMCSHMYRAYSVQGVFSCSKWSRSVTVDDCERCPHIRGFAEVR